MLINTINDIKNYVNKKPFKGKGLYLNKYN